MKSIPTGILIIATLLTAACHSARSDRPSASDEDTTIVRVKIPVADSTASQMAAFLDGYYTLKDAFVKSDTARADAAAQALRQRAAAIGLQALAQDSTRHRKATALRQNLYAEIAGLLGEQTLLAKRQELQLISDITYQLIQTTGMKDRTVYQDYCPMFNEGNGAFWLSDSLPIANPYYGDQMPDCGTVRETLFF